MRTSPAEMVQLAVRQRVGREPDLQEGMVGTVGMARRAVQAVLVVSGAMVPVAMVLAALVARAVMLCERLIQM